ncbi:hypothetical protein [Sphingosinicella sp. LY1275]|uniref:hypothetical protein n=1 Tax=Sphingosinicella sp. LY1275 TaxID=3095379 RepID=UPI002ADEBB62|nr:hypothetical protein [Sphingosinicella sp. LY1275]MEA1014179.1 hypothetical protein [Sphingosinicella sp. LY1275]
MISQCAALEAARQAREDGLVSAVTQVSAAALLAIPGLFFSADSKMPPLVESPLIYLGIISFLAALLLAMLEQHFSAKAYQRQQEITEAYYTQQSTETHDPNALARVQRMRKGSYIFFALAVLLSTAALILLR